MKKYDVWILGRQHRTTFVRVSVGREPLRIDKDDIIEFVIALGLDEDDFDHEFVGTDIFEYAENEYLGLSMIYVDKANVLYFVATLRNRKGEELLVDAINNLKRM
ncbi:MAG: hypothetical protein ABIH41_02385 [Nanoarchaeota archaeon]